MVIKLTVENKVSVEMTVTASAEVVVDSEQEAKDAGKEFYDYYIAMAEGFGEGQGEG
jgi:hypothetical protein